MATHSQSANADCNENHIAGFRCGKSTYIEATFVPAVFRLHILRRKLYFRSVGQLLYLFGHIQS